MIEDVNQFLIGFPLSWLLIALLMVFVGAPLLRRHYKPEANDDTTVNAELYQQQLENLQYQLATDDINQEQFDELVAEQQKLLLADTNDQQGVLASSRPRSTMSGGWFLVAALVLLPILALQLYHRLGASADLEITRLLEQRVAEQNEEASTATRSVLIEKIAKRLEQRPEHVGYLVTQARLLTEAAKFDEAIIYYRQAVELLPDDAGLVAEYVQGVYFAEGNRFTPNVEAAMDKALSMEPDNSMVLGLQGIQAFSAGDYRQALISWQRALAGTTPSSGQAKALRSGIARAKEQLGEPLPGVNLKVRLSPELNASSENTVFIYAVEANASPMPLAITRVTVADLPFELRLDDSMAMPGGKLLSSVATIQLIARVSLSGNATPGTGDLEGRSEPISLVEVVDGVKLEIDTIID